MTFKYKDDAVKYEYEVRYLDKYDEIISAFIPAYSEKQAEYLLKKHRPSCLRIIDVIRLEELPSKFGKQIEMDFEQ